MNLKVIFLLSCGTRLKARIRKKKGPKETPLKTSDLKQLLILLSCLLGADTRVRNRAGTCHVLCDLMSLRTASGTERVSQEQGAAHKSISWSNLWSSSAWHKRAFPEWLWLFIIHSLLPRGRAVCSEVLPNALGLTEALCVSECQGTAWRHLPHSWTKVPKGGWWRYSKLELLHRPVCPSCATQMAIYEKQSGEPHLPDTSGYHDLQNRIPTHRSTESHFAKKLHTSLPLESFS